MKPVDKLMRQAIAEKIFPGAVLLVSKEEETVFFNAYGVAHLISRTPVVRETIFDLASLTKPLATTLAVMRLVQQDQIKLEQPLAKLLPEFEHSDKAEIKLKHLLYHNSGLPDYRPYYMTLSQVTKDLRRSALRKQLLQEALVNPIGKTVLYSDLGFMILAWVVEHIAGCRLDHFVSDEIYTPMGLKHLFFVCDSLNDNRGPFAATENCPWRGKILQGQVHDENAFAVGGIEGHAGLFGTAGDINRLLLELLLTYHGRRGTGLFRQDLLRQFFNRLPGTDKALGFDMPRLVGASCGQGFSQNSIGHLGFTGTSFWMDLERGVIVILLTNRVHPTRDNERIKAFRPQLHDMVMKAIAGRIF